MYGQQTVSLLQVAPPHAVVPASSVVPASGSGRGMQHERHPLGVHVPVYVHHSVPLGQLVIRQSAVGPTSVHVSPGQHSVVVQSSSSPEQLVPPESRVDAASVSEPASVVVGASGGVVPPSVGPGMQHARQLGS